jgi:ABC-type Fe3+ transport system substrate-binding protein
LGGFSDILPETSAGSGMLGIVNRAPHPNAAIVFVNWMASQEGSEVYARARGASPTRGDIDESFVAPEMIPQPGVKYFDTQEWDYAVTQKEPARQKVKAIIDASR